MEATTEHGRIWLLVFVRRVPLALKGSAKARRAVLALCGVLAYLLIGQAIAPGFTDYWWYQVFQTSVTLLAVLWAETEFADEGGLAWQTYLIIVLATLADTLGTAGHMYDAWRPYDKIVHFTSGAVFSAAAYEVLGFLIARGRAAFSAKRHAILAVAISFLIAGVAWETYENTSDLLFNSGRVQGRGDTIGDLICCLLGAVAAVVVLHRRLGDTVVNRLGGSGQDGSRRR